MSYSPEKMARRIVAQARDRRARREVERLPSEPCFSSDWFTPRIDDMSPFIGDFIGRPGLQLLEVGSYEGRSAVWFLEQVLTGEGASITCIDVWRHLRRELYFDHNIDVSGESRRVRKIKGDSHEALQSLGDARYSIIYIDGFHRAAHVLLDAILAWPLLEPGGLMMFDDYLWNPHLPSSDRPQLAIDLFTDLFAKELELLHRDYMVILRKR